MRARGRRLWQGKVSHPHRGRADLRARLLPVRPRGGQAEGAGGEHRQHRNVFAAPAALGVHE
eukprot:scaffold361645_cov29-Prasinocladus_malaysianus.AAC.1